MLSFKLSVSSVTFHNIRIEWNPSSSLNPELHSSNRYHLSLMYIVFKHDTCSYLAFTFDVIITDFSLWTLGPDWSPKSHSGVPAGNGDLAGSQGNHRPGRGEAAGGGQPPVWLRLAGNAQSRHKAGTNMMQDSWIILKRFHPNKSFVLDGEV